MKLSFWKKEKSNENKMKVKTKIKINVRQQKLLQAIEVISETLESKKMTNEKKMLMTGLARMIVQTQRELVEHFNGFIKQQKLDNEFKKYCEKKPVSIKFVEKNNNKLTLYDEEGDEVDEVSEDQLVKTEKEKADTRYIG